MTCHIFPSHFDILGTRIRQKFIAFFFFMTVRDFYGRLLIFTTFHGALQIARYPGPSKLVLSLLIQLLDEPTLFFSSTVILWYYLKNNNLIQSTFFVCSYCRPYIAGLNFLINVLDPQQLVLYSNSTLYSFSLATHPQYPKFAK